MNKYRNKKMIVGDVIFDSKKEAMRYGELKLLLRAGKIKELELQPKFTLQPPFKKDGKTIRAITYIADFMYYDNSTKTYVIEDVKGVKTDVFKLKQKLFEYKYPDLKIQII